VIDCYWQPLFEVSAYLRKSRYKPALRYFGEVRKCLLQQANPNAVHIAQQCEQRVITLQKTPASLSKQLQAINAAKKVLLARPKVARAKHWLTRLYRFVWGEQAGEASASAYLAPFFRLPMPLYCPGQIRIILSGHTGVVNVHYSDHTRQTVRPSQRLSQFFQTLCGGTVPETGSDNAPLVEESPWFRWNTISLWRASPERRVAPEKTTVNDRLISQTKLVRPVTYSNA